MSRLPQGAALLFAAASAVAAAPEVVRGEQLYVRCIACHALASNRVGPRHCGLLGRHAGSVPGFAYSAAMRNAKITWDEKTLDLFLANPLKMVPGTSMTYDGIADKGERADLIAYLKAANSGPDCHR